MSLLRLNIKVDVSNHSKCIVGAGKKAFKRLLTIINDMCHVFKELLLLRAHNKDCSCSQERKGGVPWQSFFLDFFAED